MMMHLSSDVLNALAGKTLVTAESCTGGGIGAALTAVPGSSAVYKGGIICYTNWVKENLLGVPGELLKKYGAVSQPVAQAMAMSVRERLQADIAVSVTGLAGPGGDEYGNPVGTVFIGYCSESKAYVKEFYFTGSREDVRNQAIRAALELILEENQ
ncbi:MAG: CinA family protein [Oscillospiraceae bacterium]|nr:CinA family protein [Oscillospiraceae bacterium]